MSGHQELIGNYKIPSIAFGSAMRDGNIELVLNEALENGFRHIDTATRYQNEHIVGKVLKEWFDSGKLKREDVFVTTKLPEFGVHKDKVEEYLTKSLADLQLEYVDLYLIHHSIYVEVLPIPEEDKNNELKRWLPPIRPLPTDHIAVWKKMEEQVDLGRTKAIGISNFNERQIEKIWNAARIKPSCLQIELSPFLQQPNLVKYCQNKGIVVSAYSVLRTPFGGQPDDDLNVFKNKELQRIAEKHNKTSAQIALRYFIQNNVVVITNTSKSERMKQALEVFNFTLDSDDLQDLIKLDAGEKARKMNFLGKDPKCREHPEYPYPK